MSIFHERPLFPLERPLFPLFPRERPLFPRASPISLFPTERPLFPTSVPYFLLDDVEKLLGWEHTFGMPANRMAQQLGVTKGQLQYMLFRDELQKQAKERRIAEKIARSIPYTTYTSSKLKFSISFPAEWEVTTDMLQIESDGITLEQTYAAFQKMFPDSEMSLENYRREVNEWEPQREIPAEEAYQTLLEEERAKAARFKEFKKAYERDRRQAYRLFFEKLLGTPPDEGIGALASRELSAMEAHNRLMEDPETFLVSFPEFKEQYEWDLQQRRQAEDKRAELAQMEMGFLEASLPNSEDDPSVDVTKLKLTKPMTALELYELDKPPSEQVPTGSRPSKGVDVDGLHGVKYYYVFDIGETRKISEMHKFFNVYLAQNDEGWIISCLCKEAVFRKYKAIFDRIITSFRRT